MLAAALVVTAALAGLTGAWSPCGFSMVETIAAARGRLPLVLSLLLFTAGAAAGGVLTFGGLSLLGSWLPGAGLRAAVIVLAVVAAAAALGEVRGVRIVPQIRRQVPEAWRRFWPLPLAAGAYGVLLGAGFATFVLTLALWALALVCLGLGDVELGVLVGVAFGLARALPIAALAPGAARGASRGLQLMAEQPVILRSFRIADGLALAACATVLVAGDAGAAVTERAAVDPSAVDGALAWDGAAGGVLRADRSLRTGHTAHHLGVVRSPLPGRDPALGGSLLAWREGDVIRIVRRADLLEVEQVEVPGANALAISDRWLAVRTGGSRGDWIVVRPVGGGAERVVVSPGRDAGLSRPALDGDLLAYSVTSPRQSRIDLVRLPGGAPRTIRRSRFHELSNPSLLAGRLVYVRRTSSAQHLVLGTTSADSRVLVELPSTAHRDRGFEPGRQRGHGKPLPLQLPPRGDAYLWSTRADRPRRLRLGRAAVRAAWRAHRLVRVRR